ncbi:MAG: reverse transcriptase family protein, partial [Nitrososphaeraceae archaeon]|nr:reverse transcriptase family protein [Nitrososphaeraceae archaeon]
LNIRSATTITADLDKPAALQEFVTGNNLDILTLSESWLSIDTPPSILNSLTPPGFSIIHSPRITGLGGGLALIYRSSIKMSKILLPNCSSFESLCIRCTTTAKPSLSFILLMIYRPPSSSKSDFISDFSSVLEDLATSPSELIITGDFNVHVDQPNCSFSSSFLNLLDVFSLTQHVTFPTHSSGHTLDLIITRFCSTTISSINFTDPNLSDHYALLFSVSAPSKSKTQYITKYARSFRSINITNFCNDLLSTSLFTTPATTLEPYLRQFNSSLTSILDIHAPLKKVTCPKRERKPFITSEILTEKSKRSKLETIYRRCKTPENQNNFKIQSLHVAKLITISKRLYFRNLISQCVKQPKKLWSALNTLFSRNSPPILPNCISSSTLASSFLQFFDQKITKLCASLPTTATTLPHVIPPNTPPFIDHFFPASYEEVRKAICMSSNATCSLDIIPTFLLKSCLDVLIHPITTIINMSLSEGIFPETFKEATIRPLLKKHNLPHDDLSSYRPISNLNFLSKVLERIIHTRINSHLQTFPSLCPFQAAYRKFHSTETALIRIYNDLLLASDQQKVSALVLLDLSAAFDTIDHSILLNRLNSMFGISGTALSLLSSYLSNRTQHVTIDSQSSDPIPVTTGVPQGSVLGPLLFSLYTSPISFIFSNIPVSFHLYADDTQLYISFSSCDSSASLSILSST